MFDLIFQNAGISPAASLGLLVASFAGSFITAALGIGGGALLLVIMASMIPPAALIPVHGVIQLGSNALRAAVLIRDVDWRPVAWFALGSFGGVALGGSISVNLEPGLVQIGVGLFVLWSAFARPPAFFARAAWASGGVSSFLTMFFGATGPFVASFVKALSLPRTAHVATHAVLMTLQHGLKIAVFAILGFAFAPWIGFMLAMIMAGFLGTLVGRRVLLRMSDQGFRRALNVVLTLLALRLIWTGVTNLL